ncbi:MAG: helix-turn-helix domain-containing protein [Bacteroidota bacterium]
MSQKPIAMDHLKQILQLKRDGVAIKEIVRRTGISRNSVRKYLAKFTIEAEQIYTSKELADTAYNNEQLEQDTLRLQNLVQYLKYASTELTKTGVTRQLLWYEYLQTYPDGYGYSQFCYHLKAYRRNSDLSTT